MGRLSPEKHKKKYLRKVRYPDGRTFSFPFPGLSPGLHTPSAVHRNKVEETSRERLGTDGPLTRQGCFTGRLGTCRKGGPEAGCLSCSLSAGQPSHSSVPALRGSVSFKCYSGEAGGQQGPRDGYGTGSQ